MLSWACRDSRYYIRHTTSNSASADPTFPATCLWSQNYSLVPSNFQCLLQHCSSPLEGESSYPQPPPTNQLRLDLTAEVNDSRVPLGANISYTCAPGTYIESNETDPSRTQVTRFLIFILHFFKTYKKVSFKTFKCYNWLHTGCRR